MPNPTILHLYQTGITSPSSLSRLCFSLVDCSITFHHQCLSQGTSNVQQNQARVNRSPLQKAQTFLLSLVQTETSSIRTSLICQPVDASSLFPDICLVLVAFISIGKLGCGLSTGQLSFSGTLESVPKGLVRHGSLPADLPWLHSNRHNLYRSHLTSPHLHLRILTLSQMT